MANNRLTTQGVGEIRTDLPNIQTVQNPGSIGPAIGSAIVGAASDAYSAYVRKDASDRSTAVADQLNQDIGDIEKGSTDVGTRLEEEFAALAAEDPRLNSLTAKMSSLSTKQQQYGAARALYTLRAEAALKETLAKAPGLRKEITQIAARNLGFDPTSGTINLILRGIEGEIKGTGQAESDEFLRKDYTKRLADYGFPVTPEEFNGPVDNLGNKLKEVERLQGALDTLGASISSGQTSLQQGILQFQTNVTESLSLQLQPLLYSAINQATALTTEEDFITFEETIRSQATSVLETLRATIPLMYSRINVTNPEDRAILENASNRTVQDMESLFGSFLNSETLNIFQNKGTTLKALRDNMGLDMFMSNKVLAQIDQTSPGLLPAITMQVLATNAAVNKDLSNIVGDELSSLTDVGDPNRRILQGQLDTLLNYQAFSEMSEKDKTVAAKGLSAYLDGYITIYDQAPDTLSDKDYRAVANGVAGIFSLANQYASSDWHNVAQKGSTPAFQHLISELEKDPGEDGLLMAGIMYHTYTEAIINNLRHHFKGQIKDVPITMDLSSGVATYTGTAPSETPLKPGQLPTFTPGATSDQVNRLKQRQGEARVAELNRYIDTVYSKRHLDPSLAGLEKPQIAALLTRELRGAPSMTFTGSSKPIQAPQGADAEARRITLAEAIEGAAGTLSQARSVIQTGAHRDLASENIERIERLDQDNQALRQELEEMKKLIGSLRGS